jgi:hypothetical protein
VFWSNFLKYSYSQDMFAPVNEAFSGVIQKLKKRLKIGKEKPKEDDAENRQLEIQSPDKNVMQYASSKGDVNLQQNIQEGNKKNNQYASIEIDFEHNAKKVDL